MATPKPDPIRAILERLPVPPPLRHALFFLYDTLHNYSQHRAGETSAAIAYYSLFALFPLTLFIMSVLSYVLGGSARQAEIVQAIADRIPGSRELLEGTINQVVQARGPVTVLALVTLLWSASGVFSFLATAVNRAWCIDCGRPFWEEKLLGLTLALLIGVLVLIALASSSLAQIVGHMNQALLPPDVAGIVNRLDVVGILIAIAANIATFFVIYKFIPTVHVPWQAALLGAVVAGSAWEAAKYGFSWYLSTYAIRNFSMVYGSLSAVLGLLLWIYLTAVILLLGAELSATYVQGGFLSRPQLPVEGHE